MVWVGDYLYCGLRSLMIVDYIVGTLVRGGVTAVTEAFEKSRFTGMIMKRQNKK